MLTRKGLMSKLMVVKFVMALFIDIRRFLEFSTNLTEFLKKGIYQVDESQSGQTYLFECTI